MTRSNKGSGFDFWQALPAEDFSTKYADGESVFSYIHTPPAPRATLGTFLHDGVMADTVRDYEDSVSVMLRRKFYEERGHSFTVTADNMANFVNQLLDKAAFEKEASVLIFMMKLLRKKLPQPSPRDLKNIDGIRASSYDTLLALHSSKATPDMRQYFQEIALTLMGIDKSFDHVDIFDHTVGHVIDFIDSRVPAGLIKEEIDFLSSAASILGRHATYKPRLISRSYVHMQIHFASLPHFAGSNSLARIKAKALEELDYIFDSHGEGKIMPTIHELFGGTNLTMMKNVRPTKGRSKYLKPIIDFVQDNTNEAPKHSPHYERPKNQPTPK